MSDSNGDDDGDDDDGWMDGRMDVIINSKQRKFSNLK